MRLTREMQVQIFEDGYTKLPAMATEKQVNVALRAINHSIGAGIHPRKVAEYRATSYCPELRNHHSITDLLYDTPLWTAAVSLCGQDRIRVAGGGQIALRFPIMDKPASMAPHLDGIYTSTNRVRKGTVNSFTMLAGIFLSDIPNEYWGNFTVWPGTHLKISSYVKEHGIGSISSGLPPVGMPEPRQLLAKAGDAILCHYLLAHTVVSNVSPYIRYAVFFRLSHPDHRRHRLDALGNPWLEWPVIQRLL